MHLDYEHQSAKLISVSHLLESTTEHIPIADKSVDFMTRRAETPQLDLLPVLNVLGIAIAPFKRDFRVSIRIDQHIEGAVAI